MNLHSEHYSRREGFLKAKLIYDCLSEYRFKDEILNSIDFAEVASSIFQSLYDNDKNPAKQADNINLEKMFVQFRKKGLGDFALNKQDLIPVPVSEAVLIAGHKHSLHNWKMCKNIYYSIIMSGITTQIIDCSRTKELSPPISFSHMSIPLEELEHFYEQLCQIITPHLVYPNICCIEIIGHLVQIYINSFEWINFFRASRIKVLINTVRVTHTLRTLIFAAKKCGIKTIEVMHGVGAPYNIDYSYRFTSENDIYNTKNSLFPDIFATTHARSKQLIESSWCKNTLKSHKIVLLNQSFEAWDSSYSELPSKSTHQLNAIRPSISRELTVLIVGQHGGQQQDRLRCIANKKLLSASKNNQIHLIFRPHPLALDEDSSVLNRFAIDYGVTINYPGLNNSTTSLISQIHNADIVVGGFSSVLCS